MPAHADLVNVFIGAFRAIYGQCLILFNTCRCTLYTWSLSQLKCHTYWWHDSGKHSPHANSEWTMNKKAYTQIAEKERFISRQYQFARSINRDIQQFLFFVLIRFCRVRAFNLWEKKCYCCSSSLDLCFNFSMNPNNSIWLDAEAKKRSGSYATMCNLDEYDKDSCEQELTRKFNFNIWFSMRKKQRWIP